MLRNFALPLSGLALWFAVAVALLSTFARPSVVARAEPEWTLIAPEVVVVACGDDCCGCQCAEKLACNPIGR